jgi:hypothetical protein
MRKGDAGIYQTLLAAASMVDDDENAEFLMDLTLTLPWRWTGREKEGDLTIRFPGLASE